MNARLKVRIQANIVKRAGAPTLSSLLAFSPFPHWSNRVIIAAFASQIDCS
jgi:hypothetical protein